jgi:hypothetical protein
MEEGNRLAVQWTSRELLLMGRLLGIGLIGGGAWLFRRAKTARTKWGGGIAALAAGLLFLGVSLKETPTQRWEIGGTGIRVVDEGRITDIPWSDLESVTLDKSSSKPERASLVLRQKDGKETWLAMSWLIAAHRRKVLDALQNHAPGAMGAVRSDERYRRALDWTPS